MQIENVLKRLGYELGVTVGRGSFSKVKLATSKKHGSRVAIKIIDRKKAQKEFVTKFLPRELEILRSVKHDHIVQAYDFIEVNRYLCIIMEPTTVDLLQKIQELKVIPSTQAKIWFLQLVSAVSYLHQQDIVHRDLKCENVLLTADSQVKLTDFGFARFIEGYPQLCNTFCGSAAYTPPEVLLGMPYDAKKYDTWSLGVVLYIMIVGSMPYDDSNVRKLPQLQREPLVYPESAVMEEACRALITYLLQFDPKERPTIAQVEQHSWLQQSQNQEH